MNLPFEVRNGIYEALLVKHDTVHLECNWKPDGIKWTKSLSLGKGVTGILRACKQTETEGTNVLYGANTFECYHVRVLKNKFIDGKREYWESEDTAFPGIGKRNAAKIKKIIFGLPMVIMRGAQDSPAGNPFLDLLCGQLTGLQKFTLKTHMSGEPSDETRERQTSIAQALITTAARAVKYHPTLRKAVWRRWSGNELRSTVWGDEVVGEFFVDLMAEGFETRLEGTLTKKDALGDDFKSADILLNTLMIRKTSWLKRALWKDVKNFRLDNDQLLAKVNPSQLASWPGCGQYEPLLELEVEDQAAAVEESHCRHIDGLRIRGRFVDGKFVRGMWHGVSAFTQGHFVERRQPGAEYETPCFVEGMWVSKDEFVEGKWIEERFVKGFWARWPDRFCAKGRWEGDRFVEGKWFGEQFYEGKWRGDCLFVRGSWAQKPKIANLS